MNPMRWMEENMQYIGNRKPWEISLPGTHNSGFFNESGLYWVSPDCKPKPQSDWIDALGFYPLWFRCQHPLCQYDVRHLPLTN